MKYKDINFMQLEVVALALAGLLPQVIKVLPGFLNNPDSANAIENSLKIMKSWAEGK
jgi:hypothetical protein